MKKNSKIYHVDLFAGPGGITTGFKAAGIDTVLGVEYVQSCYDTFRANHPEVDLILSDIRKVQVSDIKKKLKKKKVDIVTAGMPCETFSTAGSKSRSFYDHRQTLFQEAIRIASGINSKFVLLENVPGITSKRISKDSDKLIIDLIYDTLSENGYKYFVDTILDSSDFGVPQNRKRFFILAANKKTDLRVPVSKHNGRTTVEDAFQGLPIIQANEEHIQEQTYTNTTSEYVELLKDKKFWRSNTDKDTITYHYSPKHRNYTLERFALIEQGEGLKDLFFKFPSDDVKNMQEKRVLPKKWYIQRNRRLKPDVPSMTVTSHCLDELLHPSLNRALTIREAARLQSFPDHYEFVGGPNICPHIYHEQDKYEQIGDAVPPLLAHAWGLTIKKIIEDE